MRAREGVRGEVVVLKLVPLGLVEGKGLGRGGGGRHWERGLIPHL